MKKASIELTKASFELKKASIEIRKASIELMFFVGGGGDVGVSLLPIYVCTKVSNVPCHLYIMD